MKKQLIMLFAFMAFAIAIKAQGYQVGDVARDFKLKNVDGKFVSLADYKTAKGFILVFTCNPCPYAKLYEQRILDLDKKYAAQGYPVIAINPNDPVQSKEDAFDKLQERAKAKGYTFPYLVDETQDISRDYGAKATPHVYLLKKSADKYIVEYIGAIDDDTQNTKEDKVKYVEDAIKALEAGKKPSVTNTKAIGCTIKWKKA